MYCGNDDGRGGSQNDHSFEWIERVVKNNFLFHQTVAVMELHNLMSPLGANDLQSLHTETTFPVFMTATCPVDHYEHFPMHSPYLLAMRISAMIAHDIKWMLHHNGKLEAVELVSLANERIALQFAVARVRELYKFLPSETMILSKQDIDRCLHSFEEFLLVASYIVNSLLTLDDPMHQRKFTDPLIPAAYCNASLLNPFLTSNGNWIVSDRVWKDALHLQSSPSDPFHTRTLVQQWLSHYLEHTLRPYLVSDKCISDSSVYRFHRKHVLRIYELNWSDPIAAKQSDILRQRYVIFQAPMIPNRRVSHQSESSSLDQDSANANHEYLRQVCLNDMKSVLLKLQVLFLLHNSTLPSEMSSFLSDAENTRSLGDWQCSEWVRDVFASPFSLQLDEYVNKSNSFPATLENLPFLVPKDVDRSYKVRDTLDSQLFSPLEEHILQSIFKRGGGGCSSRTMFTCLTNPEQQKQLCVSHLEQVHTYIGLQITIALAIQPNPFWQSSLSNLLRYTYANEEKDILSREALLNDISTKPPQALQFNETARILSVGLAGGILHNFIRLHFPNAYIESVDIDISAAHMYRRYFQPAQFFHFNQSQNDSGFETGQIPDVSSSSIMMCGIKYLDIKSENISINASITEKYQLQERIFTESNPSRSCDSFVVWANGYTYIEYLAKVLSERQDSPSQEGYFDQIIFDAYDARSLHWSGEKFGGESLAFVPELTNSLQSIRRLLRPGSGIAQFHLHKDGQCKEVVREIVRSFGGPSHIVMLDVGLEIILVAGHGFSAEDRRHPCENVEEFLHWVTVFTETLMFPEGMGELAKNSLRCDWLNSIDWEDSQNSFHIDLTGTTKY